MSDFAISTQQLSKKYGSLFAVKNITLNIERNKTTGLIGPNGAGKTTLFSLFCGFLRPSSGQVTLLGHAPDSIKLRNRIAILPQDAGFMKSIGIRKQLEMLAYLQGMSKNKGKEEAKRVLGLVGLSDKANQFPEMLSHGMKKRLSIAQALMGSPEIILLDEPTAGLDPGTTDSIKGVIRQLQGQVTVIITSHNLEVIEDLCQQVVMLKKGELHGHKEVSQMTQRAHALTFRLETEADEAIIQSFKALPNITEVKTGAAGQHLLIISFVDESQTGAVEISIMQHMLTHGIRYKEMYKGKRLQEVVSQELS